MIKDLALCFNLAIWVLALLVMRNQENQDRFTRELVIALAATTLAGLIFG